MAKNIRIERCSGSALEQFIPELARLRIEVFRDFPYLYDGDIDYEKKYLQTYIDCPESVIVIAFDDGSQSSSLQDSGIHTIHGGKVVGASTAIPMKYETEELKKPFIEQGYNLDEVFYCSESVLDKNYRGLGIGVRFFEQREAHAEDLGGFKHICFCCVERPIDHPRRPIDYVPLDKFWNKRGYVKHPELNTRYTWKDLDDEDETPKPMTFWLKHER
ncbi:MAG: GNAT family N-acetyltransferase [Methylobacter sp.]|nr:GNAT family N-acetyltransferase [Methylobacter sp.]